ncbi:response regulator [Kibdelosporangium phytohabitans]|uniref:LuxR family transcriptional regulator n=1 Tax=Kibdelosporangium phytohabitans TaxID=860235 RepID=A0A0N9HP06_9PSEU|nr:response regulator transcription factor [Kibdelosporangium phytohabitans]ALG08737.1 LuxR family transcriptional regulator [Kibdelosporangium phytohabitans]MBE1470147.1 DNA-binding NarL/FixJ family response regulator [Kibdelosporangium phytohabitans]
MIKVIVVDDQQVVREGLVALLDLLDDVTVVGSAADGRQALDVLRANSADVVLMDLRMPELDGVAATKMITRDHPGTAVLVLTTYADDSSIADALRAGARGYLTKDAGRAQIAMALRSTAAGQSIFDPKVSERLVAALDGRPRTRQEPPDGLTARETEVLGLITRGLTNPEIAAELFISEATVKTHINNVFAKIGVRHRAEAVRYGLGHDL